MKESIGPFELEAEINDGGITVAAGIDWHGIKAHEELHLSLSHPKASFNTPNIANFSAGLTIELDEASGDLTLTLKECNPDPSITHPLRQHCSQTSKPWHIMPKDGLCLMTSGLTSAGLDFLQQKNCSISCSQLQQMRPYMTTEAQKGLKAIGPAGQGKLISALETAGQAEAGKLVQLGEARITDLLTKVMEDPRIKALMGTQQAAPEAVDALPEDQSPGAIIAEVVGGIAGGAGLGIGGLGVLIAVVGLALAAVVASPTIGVGVALAICIAAAFVGIVALALAGIGIVAIVIGLVVGGLVLLVNAVDGVAEAA